MKQPAAHWSVWNHIVHTRWRFSTSVTINHHRILEEDALKPFELRGIRKEGVTPDGQIVTLQFVFFFLRRRCPVKGERHSRFLKLCLCVGDHLMCVQVETHGFDAACQQCLIRRMSLLIV